MHLLPDRLRARLEPAGLTPAEGLALLVLVVGAVALTAMVWWTNRPVPVSTPAPSIAPGRPLDDRAEDAADGDGAGDPRSPSTTAPADTSAADLVVHVTGQVVRPGLVTVPTGSRVADALEAAGGTTPTAVLDALNLARPVVDGEQVRVPAAGDPVDPPPLAAGEPETAGPLDLNAATLEQLQQLPGVGPVTAQRILDHRTDIGGFADVSQLLEVPGIGPARFADLEPRVRT